MKKLISTAIALATLAGFALPVAAADNKVMLPIAAAMADNNAPYRLGENIKFYFGKQPTPPVLKVISSDKTSLRTNAFGKSNEKACNWVFLSDMLQLKKRAEELGANAVINIVSNYDNIEYSSETEFECHVGAIMAGVAFKADFVRIADK